MANTMPAAGTTISSGTLKMSDLIPAAFDLLNSMDEVVADKIGTEWKDVMEGLYCKDIEERDYDRECECFDAITDKINDLLPDDRYFGSIEGDGACFGVWSLPQDEISEEE